MADNNVKKFCKWKQYREEPLDIFLGRNETWTSNQSMSQSINHSVNTYLLLARALIWDIEGAVSLNSATLGNYKMPVKLVETKITA